MKALGNVLFFIAFITIPMMIAVKCEQGKDPYEPGAHWNYTIQCENGFVYKSLGGHRGTIQVFNSDCTTLKCGEKIY